MMQYGSGCINRLLQFAYCTCVLSIHHNMTVILRIYIQADLGWINGCTGTLIDTHRLNFKSFRISPFLRWGLRICRIFLTKRRLIFFSFFYIIERFFLMILCLYMSVWVEKLSSRYNDGRNRILSRIERLIKK